MKKLAFYFYLAFIVGAIVCIPLNLIDNEFIGYVILGQLIWSPISIIHCFMLFFTYPKNEIKKHINTSFSITILYFFLLIVFANIDSSIIEIEFLPAIYLFVIPWFMLAYFTYIQYMIFKCKQSNPLNIEKNLIN